MGGLMMPDPYWSEITEKEHYLFFQGHLPKLATKVPVGRFILNGINVAKMK